MVEGLNVSNYQDSILESGVIYDIFSTSGLTSANEAIYSRNFYITEVVGAFRLEEFSIEVYEEYVALFTKAYDKIEGLLGKMREKVDEFLRDDVSYEEVRQVVLSSMNLIEGYATFSALAIRSINHFFGNCTGNHSKRATQT